LRARLPAARRHRLARQHRLAGRLHARPRPHAKRRARPAEPGACGHAEAPGSRRRSLRAPPRPWGRATRRWKSRFCRPTATRKFHLPLTVLLHRSARVHGDGQRFDSPFALPLHTSGGPHGVRGVQTPALTSRPHNPRVGQTSSNRKRDRAWGRDLRAAGYSPGLGAAVRNPNVPPCSWSGPAVKYSEFGLPLAATPLPNERAHSPSMRSGGPSAECRMPARWY
jgi:hypothetical protein